MEERKYSVFQASFAGVTGRIWLPANRKSSSKQAKLSRKGPAHTIGSPEVGTSRIWQPNYVIKARVSPLCPSAFLGVLSGMVSSWVAEAAACQGAQRVTTKAGTKEMPSSQT